MEWSPVLLSLLEKKKNTCFSNCCLFPLESMEIINKFPMKKNYVREKEVPGPRVVLELKGEQGDTPTLA